MSVYKKLQEARIALQAVPLKKSGKNKFAGYEYFELGDFLPTIQEICLNKGLCGTIAYGKEIATLTIRDTDKPDYAIEFTCPMSTAALKGCHEVQNMGAVLNNSFLIPVFSFYGNAIILLGNHFNITLTPSFNKYSLYSWDLINYTRDNEVKSNSPGISFTIIYKI